MNFHQKTLQILFAVLLFVSCSKEEMEKVSAAYSVKDDLGNVVKFEEPPKRVITLAPNLTEMIFDLGADKFLVGDTKYCNYPEAAKKVANVGDLLTFDYEKILTLKPDLIFITVEGNTKESYDKFTELGLKLFISDPRNYRGIKKTYSDFGKIFKMEDRAQKRIAEWDSTVNNVKEEAAKLKPQTIMLVVDMQPVMLAGENTFLNEFIQFCNMKNIAAGSPLNYPVYSREEILKRDPAYIIYPTNGDETIKKIEETYPEWKDLTAVKKGNVYLADYDLYFRPGPRFAEALNKLFTTLFHPKQKALRNRK